MNIIQTEILTKISGNTVAVDKATIHVRQCTLIRIISKAGRQMPAGGLIPFKS